LIESLRKHSDAITCQPMGKALAGPALVALVAFALAAPAQSQDATVVVTDEELLQQRLADGIEMCSSMEGQEQTVCLANLSLAAGSSEPCSADPTGECSRVASRVAMSGCGLGRSEVEAVECELEVAALYAEPDSCQHSSSSPLCLGVALAVQSMAEIEGFGTAQLLPELRRLRPLRAVLP